MKMSPDEVMTSMQPHQSDYVDRWPQVIKPEDPMSPNGPQPQQQQHQQHLQVSADVISMQYMELEEFLLENAVPEGNGKVFIDNNPLNEKHYHVSLEQRGMGITTSPNVHQGYTEIPNHLNGGNNVHLLNIHQNQHDPNSPPQSSCDSPPQQSQHQMLHSPRSNNTSSSSNNINHLSTNSTARKSLPRRVSTSSNNSSLVVTPPHTPQQPSPPHSNMSERPAIKNKRAVKRSKKESVPDDSKDDKYWRRRAKNNAAAKRSRDLRREKENHIMQRVTFLEKENRILHQEMDSIKMENEELKERLARYETSQIKVL